MPWTDPHIAEDPDSNPCPQCVGKGYPPGRLPFIGSAWVDCDYCEGTGRDLTKEEGLDGYLPLEHLNDPTDPPNPFDTADDYTLIDTDDICDKCGEETPETD